MMKLRLSAALTLFCVAACASDSALFPDVSPLNLTQLSQDSFFRSSKLRVVSDGKRAGEWVECASDDTDIGLAVRVSFLRTDEAGTFVGFRVTIPGAAPGKAPNAKKLQGLLHSLFRFFPPPEDRDYFERFVTDLDPYIDPRRPVRRDDARPPSALYRGFMGERVSEKTLLLRNALEVEANGNRFTACARPLEAKEVPPSAAVSVLTRRVAEVEKLPLFAELERAQEREIYHRGPGDTLGREIVFRPKGSTAQDAPFQFRLWEVEAGHRTYSAVLDVKREILNDATQVARIVSLIEALLHDGVPELEDRTQLQALVDALSKAAANGGQAQRDTLAAVLFGKADEFLSYTKRYSVSANNSELFNVKRFGLMLRPLSQAERDYLKRQQKR